MSGAMSLERSIRTCSVNTGEANRLYSDRYENPNNMVCIPWNGLNNKGQIVSVDSFYTKQAGCSSAEDRVMVENSLRPNYMSYVTLGAQGIQGSIYGNMEAKTQALGRDNMVAFIEGSQGMRTDASGNVINPNQFTGGTGNFGKSFGANVKFQGCSQPSVADGSTSYERAMQQVSTQQRNQQYLQQGYTANQYQRNGGMRPQVV